MKLLKSLRRRKPRQPNSEKVILGFVRALAELRPATASSPQPNTRSKT